MKQKFMFRICSLAIVILLASCTSTTMIQSVPSGAKVKINGEYVGETPVEYSDSKISFSRSDMSLELAGYQTFETSLYKDEKVNVGAVVGGLFFWVPFLWAMEYKPEHTYTLLPLRDEFRQLSEGENQKDNPQGLTDMQIARLRELKKLLDDGILTQEEFNAEKSKILGKSK